MSERLSAQERAHRADAERAVAYPGEPVAPMTVRGRGLLATIDRLAAHLADVESRLAAVEALADKIERSQSGPEDNLIGLQWAVMQIRRALHPDSSETTQHTEGEQP